MIEFVSATADIRGEYRDTLTRVWDSALPMTTFVLLNPTLCNSIQLCGGASVLPSARDTAA